MMNMNMSAMPMAEHLHVAEGARGAKAGVEYVYTGDIVHRARLMRDGTEKID